MLDVIERKRDRREKKMRHFKMDKGKRNRLASFRIKKGLTQRQMASVLCMSFFHYNRLENGHADVRLIYFYRLQEVFGLSDDQIEEMMKKD